MSHPLLREGHFSEQLNVPIPYRNEYICQSCSKNLAICSLSFVRFRRLFGTKCAKCSSSFAKNDFVMRAKNKIYHVECFRCVACSRKLIPGDEFALREDGLFCKEDHQIVEKATACAGATQVTQARQPLRSASQSGGKLFVLRCGGSSFAVITI